MNSGTPSQWLQQLDELDPPAEAWLDPEFVDAVSWAMLMFLWRRVNQLLINAGAAPALPGTDCRTPEPAAD
jgi:hypothetical protein